MFLKRIEIQDLRSIAEVEIDFTAEDGGNRRRTVLLGDNGCGKSTALRAVALLLAGSDALTELLKEPVRWIRNGRKQARIAATLTTQKGEERHIELILRPEWNLRETLKQNEGTLSSLDDALAHTARNYFLIGYGVTRRPAYSAQEFSQIAERGFSNPRSRSVATLFSPEATLVSFEQWAMDIDYRTGGAGLAPLERAMGQLLRGMKLKGIDRQQRELIFRTADGLVPFQQLSDGYQNMANLCGDMLYRITTLFEDYKTPQKTRGLLLVDELDLHLHPIWQRQLIEFLHSALPNLQILATTHSPMIAQQLRDHELYVVERPSPRKGARIRAVAGDPSRLTLSQLLSPMFGIETSESVRVDRLRQQARDSKGAVSREVRAELAEVVPLDNLPAATKAQIKVAEEMTLAVSKAAGVARPRLDPAKLRSRLKERIKLDDPHAGVIAMIHLKRRRAAIPAKYRGAKLKALMEKLLGGYYDFQQNVPFNQKANGFQQWAGSKVSLKAESNDKCAYCEANTGVAAHSDVEHFRPKDLYWWMAYSYDNYTYSCQLCNQKFKSANFPVAGTRLLPPVQLPKAKPSPADLATLASQLCLDPANDNDTALITYFTSEDADLPHPYLDLPEELFAWTVDDVNREVRLVDNGSGARSTRAVQAAETFLGLNREELLHARYAQYSLLYAQCLVLQEVTEAHVRELSLRAVRLFAEDIQPYAGMSRYFLRQWGVLA